MIVPLANNETIFSFSLSLYFPFTNSASIIADLTAHLIKKYIMQKVIKNPIRPINRKRPEVAIKSIVIGLSLVKRIVSYH